MHYKVLADTTRYFKEDEKGVLDMRRVMDIKYEQGYEQGCVEGRAEGAANMLNMLMRNMNLTAEQVMAALNITPEEYANYKKLAENTQQEA